MDALKFLTELDRMCNSFRNCEGCPFVDEGCRSAPTKEKAEDIISVVEKWSEEHPQKTRLDDFKEKYPHAPMSNKGFPETCCAHLGYCKDCDAALVDCKRCLTMPLEEQ